ncbi:unnamed protein product [Penicillium salamii]|uniref:HTH OST-type domain-containing protein n=1 Tax=Penicillium salamii TaxID=1612424 RepID=A0A9W4IYQ2_9EURO|nr:unnamed protein product [Penicillium salamii]
MTLDVDHLTTAKKIFLPNTHADMASNPISRLAVFIDADNAQYSVVRLLLREIERYGTAHVKRAYGDWTDPSMKGWSAELLNHSIQPIQQFAYTRGKNATDSAMIIDAMDLLHSSRFDAFCLVSSDGDFTPLATRVRESGLVVYGFGEQKTPKAFVAACDEFIYTENLIRSSELERHSARSESLQGGALFQQDETDDDIIQKQETEKGIPDNSGWARLSDVGEHLSTQHPEFDISMQGHSELSKVFADSPDFDIERRVPQEGETLEFYVRKKETIPESAHK